MTLPFVADAFGIDRALGALFWHAKAGETVSLMAARDARAGKRTGCVMCWFLGRFVQRNHCAIVLDPTDTSPPPIAAGPWLLLYALVVCAAVCFPLWLLIHFLAGVL